MFFVVVVVGFFLHSHIAKLEDTAVSTRVLSGTHLLPGGCTGGLQRPGHTRKWPPSLKAS